MTDLILPPIPQNLDPMVRAAIQNWNDWRLRGAPSGEIHRRSSGLCDSIGMYFRAHDGGSRNGYKLCGELFSENYPFGKDNYAERYLLDTQHLDPARIAWVEATLAANPVGDEQ